MNQFSTSRKVLNSHIHIFKCVVMRKGDECHILRSFRKIYFVCLGATHENFTKSGYAIPTGLAREHSMRIFSEKYILIIY